MLVAEITKDYLNDKWNEEGGEYNSTSYVGKQFDSEALRNWWGWQDDRERYNDNYFQLALDTYGKTTFKLYDDDDELYYSGWLINDDECMVQQFVLSWAERDSGCTRIMVHRPNPVPGEGGGKYVQEIG